MKTLVIFFLLISNLYAALFDEDKLEYTDTKGKKYSVIEIPLVSDYKLKKPVINEIKILNTDEQEVVEFSLKENGRKLIHKELRPVKNDYQNDFDRGTVEYTPKCRNYSFHKVIIPDGTIIENSNFTQKNPDTKAIEGKNLTFIGCNLVNNAVDSTWIVQGSNTAQIKRIKKSEITQGDGSIKIIISHQVKQKDGTYLEVAEDEEITNDIDSYNAVINHLSQ